MPVQKLNVGNPFGVPNEFIDFITPDGRRYSFASTGARWIVTFQDIGLPPIDPFITRGPLDDFDTISDFRLRPRIIRLLIHQEFASRLSLWAARFALYNDLRPNRQTGTAFATGALQFTLADGTTRRIDAIIADGPAFGPRAVDRWEEFSLIEVLDFVCHDPTFYDPTAATVSFTLAASDELTFPITFDILAVPPGIVFGGSTLVASQDITYTGTWKTFPTITLTGPLNQPTITNATTGEMIELNTNIANGRVFTIDLEAKTVVDDLGQNQIGTITTDSNFATFHLAPAPEAPGGVNTIQVAAAGVVPGTSEILLTYNVRDIAFPPAGVVAC